MDPSALLRWVTSKVMTYVISPKRLAKNRIKVEKQRQASHQRHTVEYFHQVDDGYSHLAAQALAALAERYDIELTVSFSRWASRGKCARTGAFGSTFHGTMRRK
jgi:hypothetical protein